MPFRSVATPTYPVANITIYFHYLFLFLFFSSAINFCIVILNAVIPTARINARSLDEYPVATLSNTFAKRITKFPGSHCPVLCIRSITCARNLVLFRVAPLRAFSRSFQRLVNWRFTFSKNNGVFNTSAIVISLTSILFCLRDAGEPTPPVNYSGSLYSSIIKSSCPRLTSSINP